MMAVLTAAPARAESPQRFALEVKFGPYRPDMDASPGLSRPVFSICSTRPMPLVAIASTLGCSRRWSWTINFSIVLASWASA